MRIVRVENEGRLRELDAVENKRVVGIDESLFTNGNTTKRRLLVVPGSLMGSKEGLGGVPMERWAKGRQYITKSNEWRYLTWKHINNRWMVHHSFASLSMPFYRTPNNQSYSDNRRSEGSRNSHANRAKFMVTGGRIRNEKKKILRKSYFSHLTNFPWRQGHPNHEYLNEILILFDQSWFIPWIVSSLSLLLFGIFIPTA